MPANTQYSFTLIKTLTEHDREVVDLNFSTDGKFMVSGGEDGKVETYTVPGFESYYGIGVTDARIWSVAFSVDGEYLACGGADPVVRLYSLKDGQYTKQFIHHSSFINRIAFTPDGLYLASAGFDGLLNVYSMRSFKLIRSFGDHDDVIADMAVSADSQLLATCSADKTIKLYDLNLHTLIHSFQGSAAFTNIQFSPDGKYLAVGEVSGKVILYQLSDKTLIHTFDIHPDISVTACFSPEGDLIMLAYGNGSVYAYSLKDKGQVATLAGHTGRVCRICFSPDGRFLASGGYDRSINIYEVTTGGAPARNKEVVKIVEETVRDAEWFNTPERRLLWWNGLDDQWKKVFGQSLFYKYKTYASVTDHQISTIFNLKELYLRREATRNFQFSDIGFSLANLDGIKNLTRLEKLECQGNEICDVSPVRNLTNLRKLNCSNNRISDLSPLKGMLKNLNELSCTGNALSSAMEKEYTINSDRSSKLINEPLLIMPGASIGDIRIGDKVSSVINKLGNDYSVQKWEKYTEVTYTYQSLGIVFKEDSHVDWGINQIIVFPPARAKTPAGISLLESNLADVIALYGEPDDYGIMDGEEFSEDIWQCWTGDIAFCVERDMRLPKFPLNKNSLLDKPIVRIIVGPNPNT